LQSFVMNNCVGPRRYLRYVRVFAVLARAPQLARLELVGTRFIEGLLEQIVDRHEPPILCFRNLQRLVLAGNRDSTAVDAGLLLLAGQQSLVHAALQIWHTKNALFEALSYARVRLSRLESLILVTDLMSPTFTI
uniref:Mic1 domain-containing protein n=1 Tax=Hydatigena taeniaeformis TaxID=6205 RepID=A0A0R3WYA1_HYDTA